MGISYIFPIYSPWAGLCPSVGGRHDEDSNKGETARYFWLHELLLLCQAPLPCHLTSEPADSGLKSLAAASVSLASLQTPGPLLAHKGVPTHGDRGRYIHKILQQQRRVGTDPAYISCPPMWGEHCFASLHFAVPCAATCERPGVLFHIQSTVVEPLFKVHFLASATTHYYTF